MSRFLKDIGVPILAVVATALSAYLTYRANRIESDLHSAQTAIAALTEQRLERESSRELNFRLYEAVKGSLENQNRRQQEVARALVVAMADDDLRDPLLRVLGEEAQPDVKQAVRTLIVNESQFRVDQREVDQRALAPASAAPTEWIYDIFWCESAGRAGRELAERLRARLQSAHLGTVRLRMLPESVNMRPGYQVSEFEIRYDADETSQAEKLARLLDPGLPAGGHFLQRPTSGRRTPHYLSVFLCG